MYASFYAAMQGLEVRLVETLEHLGGQLTAIYPEKDIYDLPGHPKIRASEIIDQLRIQMDRHSDKIDVSTGTMAIDVEKQPDTTFHVKTTRDECVAKTILITAGNGAFSPRKLEVTSKEITNLHYFITEMEQFKDKNVVIFGGGDSAVDWALMLDGVAKRVSLVHRRNDFRAHASSIEKLGVSSVEVFTPYKPLELIGAGNVASQVALEHLETGEKVMLDVDDVIVLFGFVSNLGPIKDWGLELKKAAVAVDMQDQTSISGIFAAGDASTFNGKVKMITSGFGEAVVAINAARTYAFPDQKVRHQHSSNAMEK